MGGGGVCFSDGGDLFLSGRGGYPMGGIGLYVGEGEFKKIVGYWGGGRGGTLLHYVKP